MSNKVPNPTMAHVCFDTSDMDRCLNFYKTAFAGFEIVRTWIENGMRVSVFKICEGCTVEVFERRKTEEEPKDVAWHHIALDTTDIHAAYENAIAAGATGVIPPTAVTIPSEPPCPVWFCFVAGPDKEQIEFNMPQ